LIINFSDFTRSLQPLIFKRVRCIKNFFFFHAKGKKDLQYPLGGEKLSKRDMKRNLKQIFVRNIFQSFANFASTNRKSEKEKQTSILQKQ